MDIFLLSTGQQATFPLLKYPLEDHVEENRKAEEEALADVERIITTHHLPPCAVVVEPIQSEGGDNHASPAFFRGLRALTKKHNVLLIVDEVQTGVGATGKFWAHEHWNLETPTRHGNLLQESPNRWLLFWKTPTSVPTNHTVNSTLGWVTQLVLFSSVPSLRKLNVWIWLTTPPRLETTFTENLNSKGQGTFLAFDSNRRDEVLKKAKGVGINIGGSGERAVRLRPMLIFQEHHADILLEGLEKIFKS
ncbi:hypothetical protein DID88_007392 [Monilinia fructigena]|uniref:Uncharacterized protein n=1 Tax=Monilinia fructigena TaxID=38457 RepID=A0A395J985_9HELO|nr:hypothetical protein DID88_007392 [Monilinia fructigena]